MTVRRSLSATFDHMGRVLRADDIAALPDAELVGRFVERRDEAAFTALVRRHGSLVLAVCRRVLRHEQDAEDAFQATFLVLARNAASVGRAGAVGNWLYGVAYNVARKAKTVRYRREAKEREAATQRPDPPAETTDLRELLDGELRAMPDRYRAPVVLCDLMGLTIREAAAEVGCPAKTLGTRLTRGRTLLAGRLTRKGVSIGAAGLVAALTQLTPAANAAVPAKLLDSTTQTAIGFATGAAVVPPAVAVLAEGVKTVTTLKTLKLLAVGFVVVAAAGVSVGPLRSALHGAHGGSGSARSTETGSPARDRQPSLLEQIHNFLFHLLHGDTKIAAAADDQDKPALSGTWGKKDAEPTVTFADDEVMKISPHGKDNIILVVCSYTADKDGKVKAKITSLEGLKANDVKDKLPVGTEFGFTWKVKDGKATMEDYKSDKLEAFKSLLEGEYDKK